MSTTDGRLGDWLDAVAARTPAPGGGSAAAVALAGAAALGAMVARSSARTLPDVDMLTARADTVRRRALELAAADEAVVGALYAGQAGAGAHDRGTPAPGDPAPTTGDLLLQAAGVPLEILETAVSLAPLLRRLRVEGNQRLAGDAQVALELVEAAARGAATLVRIDAQALAEPHRARMLSALDAAAARLGTGS